MGFCCNGLGWGRWMGWGGGWVGAILGLALLAAALAVVGLVAVWVVRKMRRGGVASGAAGDSLEIARRRLASGEISAEEYEQIRRVLRGEG